MCIRDSNGSVSVLKKFPRDTPCNKDLHMEPPTAKQPSLPLLVDGVLNPVNMRLYSVDAEMCIRDSWCSASAT